MLNVLSPSSISACTLYSMLSTQRVKSQRQRQQQQFLRLLPLSHPPFPPPPLTSYQHGSNCCSTAFYVCEVLPIEVTLPAAAAAAGALVAAHSRRGMRGMLRKLPPHLLTRMMKGRQLHLLCLMQLARLSRTSFLSSLAVYVATAAAIVAVVRYSTHKVLLHFIPAHLRLCHWQRSCCG